MFNEGIATFLSLIRHVSHARRLTGKDLLSGQTIIGQVESKFQHTDSLWRLRCNDPSPLQGGFLQLSMGNGLVNDAPALRSIGVIAPGKEENLTCTLIARLAREQRRAITGIKRTNIRIGLHERGMLTRSNREIAHNI